MSSFLSLLQDHLLFFKVGYAAATTLWGDPSFPSNAFFLYVIQFFLITENILCFFLLPAMYKKEKQSGIAKEIFTKKLLKPKLVINSKLKTSHDRGLFAKYNPVFFEFAIILLLLLLCHASFLYKVDWLN